MRWRLCLPKVAQVMISRGEQEFEARKMYVEADEAWRGMNEAIQAGEAR